MGRRSNNLNFHRDPQKCFPPLHGLHQLGGGRSVRTKSTLQLYDCRGVSKRTFQHDFPQAHVKRARNYSQDMCRYATQTHHRSHSKMPPGSLRRSSFLGLNLINCMPRGLRLGPHYPGLESNLISML